MSLSNQDTEYVNPRHLPEDHPLRNTLLVDIGAKFKHPGWIHYVPLVPGRPLADNTYNTLTGVWVDFYEWRVKPRIATSLPSKD